MVRHAVNSGLQLWATITSPLRLASVELTTSFPMRGFDEYTVGDHRVAFRRHEKGWQVSADAAMTGSSGRKKSGMVVRLLSEGGLLWAGGGRKLAFGGSARER